MHFQIDVAIDTNTTAELCAKFIGQDIASMLPRLKNIEVRHNAAKDAEYEQEQTAKLVNDRVLNEVDRL